MKSGRNLTKRRGFTMLELLTAVAVTSVIITVLIGMTRVAIDAWSESRDQTKAARVAKEALDKISRDLEGVIVRSGNDFQWLVVEASKTESTYGPSDGEEMPNPTRIIFFSGATDRYEGAIGTEKDLGGDVSAIAYETAYKNQLDPNSNDFRVFSLYRRIIDPKETFDKLLSQEDLAGAYGTISGNTLDSNNYLAENIFDLTITFVFEREVNGVIEFERVSLIGGGQNNLANSLKIYGNRIVTSNEELSAGERLSSVEISLFVLPDGAANTLSRRDFADEDAFSEFLRTEGYHYSKSIILPRP